MDLSHTSVGCNCQVYTLSSDRNIVPMDPPINDDQYFFIQAFKSESNWHLLEPGIVGLSSTDFATTELFNVSKNSIDQIANFIPTQFGIPQFLGSSISTKILDSARTIANDTHKDKKILFMAVVIKVIRTSYDPSGPTIDDQYHQAVQESMDNQSLKLVPASKSFIEGLKTVKLEEEESSNCAICLEDLRVGLEDATRMPCSHVFHKPCIVNWLHQNNTCPLCRFQSDD